MKHFHMSHGTKLSIPACRGHGKDSPKLRDFFGRVPLRHRQLHIPKNTGWGCPGCMVPRRQQQLSTEALRSLCQPLRCCRAVEAIHEPCGASASAAIHLGSYSIGFTLDSAALMCSTQFLEIYRASFELPTYVYDPDFYDLDCQESNQSQGQETPQARCSDVK